jgi:AcrR family transcriptional regulator
MTKSEEKREQILDAAMHCLAKYGMLKSTMDDIAKLMGLKKAALYYYYKNKEAIFHDALEREANRYYENVQKKIIPQMTASEKLVISVGFYYDYFASRADILELNTQAMIDNHSLIQAIYKQNCKENRSYFAHLIKEGIKSGEFRGMNAEKAAEALRLILETQRLEKFRQAFEQKQKEPDYKQLKKDSLFILDIFINGIKNER